MDIKWDSLIVMINDGLKELVALHWLESGVHDYPMAVDWPRYGMLEHEGIIRWISVRKDGELVGYCSVCITMPLHRMFSKSAMVDMIMLHPKARKGTAGSKMIDKIIKLVEAENVATFMISETCQQLRDGKPSFGTILNRKGFKLHEYAWIKRMGD